MATHNKTLSIKQEDIDFLTTFIKKGTHKAREIKRARVLLLLHRGKNILSVATDTEYSKGNTTQQIIIYEGKEDFITQARRAYEIMSVGGTARTLGISPIWHSRQ